jgi:hypothetical protein
MDDSHGCHGDIKCRGKIFPVLNKAPRHEDLSIKHHAMNMYGGVEI